MQMWKSCLLETYFNKIEINNLVIYHVKNENYNGLFRLLIDSNCFPTSNSSNLEKKEFLLIRGDICNIANEQALLGNYPLDQLDIKNIIIDLSTEAINIDNQFYIHNLQKLSEIVNQNKYKPFKFLLVHANSTDVDLKSYLVKIDIHFANLNLVGFDFYLARFLLDLNKEGVEIHSSDNPNTHEVKEKHFICLNHRPRWHRYAVVLSLLENNLLSKGIVSFAGDEQGRIDAPTVDSLNFSIENIAKLANGQRLLAHLDNLNKMTPLIVDRNPHEIQNELWGKEKTGHIGQPLGLDKDNNKANQQFSACYFEIITETFFTGETCNYITEKTLRPILSLRPFICVATPYLLRKLKSYGFKTFAPYFNEDYDDILDPYQRMDFLLNEINRLAAMPIEQLHAMYNDLRETLLYNRAHYLQHFQKILADKILMPSIEKFITA